MKFSTLPLLLVANAPGTIVEKAVWHECLEAHAQVTMMGTKSAVSIAIEGQKACRAEEQALMQRLMRARAVAGTDGQTTASVVTTMQLERQLAAKRVLAFIARYR